MQIILFNVLISQRRLNNMNNTLVLMCGAPGSGKTTIAKKLMCNNDLYISRDEIRYSMISDEDEYFSKEKGRKIWWFEIILLLLHRISQKAAHG